MNYSKTENILNYFFDICYSLSIGARSVCVWVGGGGGDSQNSSPHTPPPRKKSTVKEYKWFVFFNQKEITNI